MQYAIRNGRKGAITKKPIIHSNGFLSKDAIHMSHIEISLCIPKADTAAAFATSGSTTDARKATVDMMGLLVWLKGTGWYARAPVCARTYRVNNRSPVFLTLCGKSRQAVALLTTHTMGTKYTQVNIQPHESKLERTKLARVCVEIGILHRQAQELQDALGLVSVADVLRDTVPVFPVHVDALHIPESFECYIRSQK